MLWIFMARRIARDFGMGEVNLYQSKFCGENRPALERVALTRYQPTGAIFDVSERPKALPLQLKEPVWVTERIDTAA